MIPVIEHIAVFDDRTLVVDSHERPGITYQGQVWVRDVSRKYTRCVISNRFICKGAAIYRPETVLQNKGWHMLVSAVENLPCSPE